MFSQLEWFTIAQTIDLKIDQIEFTDFQFGARQIWFARKQEQQLVKEMKQQTLNIIAGCGNFKTLF